MRMITEEHNSHWIIRFSIACVVGIVAIGAFCWVVVGSLDLYPAVAGPLILAITLTGVLEVGLMALVFYTSRSGQDDRVRVAPSKRKHD
jgi:hypothetical protein